MNQKLLETLSKYNTIILVGGGTGGHIQPILNISEELQDQKLLWIGGKDSNEEKESIKSGIPFRSISTLKLSTTLSPKILLYPFVLAQGIMEARRILLGPLPGKGEMSDEGGQRGIESDKNPPLPPLTGGRESIGVFSKGGPGSVAIGIAAWSLGIPLYIHESDTIPGRSNRILGRFATRIFLGFDSAKKYFEEKKCEVIGQILHPVFSSTAKGLSEGNKDGGLVSEHSETPIPPTPLSQGGKTWQTDKPHILVICGSQGAKSIFEAIIDQFSGSEECEWIIALGKLNSDMKKDFSKMKHTQALEWISQEDIAHLIQDSDIAITRGSATTLAELTAFRSSNILTSTVSNTPTFLHSNIRLIIIPLPYAADNHQYWNAREYEKKGDTLLEQKDLNKLTEIIKKYVSK